MSGHSGGGEDPVIRPNEVQKNCASLSFNTHLASPNSEVIENFMIGDQLTLIAITERGPINAYNRDGEAAGAILSPYSKRLLDCINKGTSYIAVVLAIDGGSCEIRVEAL